MRMQFLDATTDIAFKKLFGDQKRSGLTISFLNSVLGLKQGELIATITIMTGENLPLAPDGKRSFLDINCIDEQGRNYIVEVQKQDEGNFLSRAQFYVGNALARQLPKKADYKDLVPVIFVGVVVNFEIFPLLNDFLTHHGIVNFKTGIKSHFHSEYHYLELKKFTKQEYELVNDVEKWAYLLKHAHDLDHIPSAVSTSTELNEAFEVLEHGMWNNHDLAVYLAEQELLYKDENIEAAATAKALAIGLEEGRNKEKKEIARNLLAQGFEVKIIAAATGLTLDEIEKIRTVR